MKAVCRICEKEFNANRKTQKLCRSKECKKAAWNAYQRGRHAKRSEKPKPKTEGYGREPGIRADRCIDTGKPLPAEDIILHDWSYWTIMAEVQRLDKVIARCRAGNP